MKYIVTATQFLNVRSAPGVGNKAVGKLATGTTFESNGISQLVGQYNWIQLLDKSGWVALELVRHADKPATYVVTEAVNLRFGPATTYGVEKVLPVGFVLNIYPGVITYNGIDFVATDGGYVAAQYVRPFSSTPAPISNPNSKIGIHCHIGVNKDAIVSAVHNCWMAGKSLGVFTVIDDVGLAQALAQYNCTVVFRRVDTNHDSRPPIPQNEPLAIQAGINWANLRWEPAYDELPKNVAVQWDNEEVWDKFDYAFEIGVMMACENRGYKAVIFNDAVGNPTGADWVTKWASRVPAMQRAMRNGHYVGQHIYGGPEHPNDGVSNPSNAYYATRFLQWWDTMPDNGKPSIVINEAGVYNANVTSADFALQDCIGFAKILENIPQVLGFAYWTAGGPGMGFPTFDPLPVLSYIKGN